MKVNETCKKSEYANVKLAKTLLVTHEYVEEAF